MNGFLLDTNCVSELVRVRPETSVVKWLREADDNSLYLSILTLGEIRKGIVTAPESRKLQIEEWLTVELRRRFEGRVLPVDAAIADRWGVLTGEAKLAGRTLPVIDSIIAATALHHNLIVVTRNVVDFQTAKVSVLNPWEAMPLP